MLIIINDNKKATGKTTIAREFLKGKNFLELPTAAPLIRRFWNFDIIPEWIFIDGASEKDMDVIKRITDIRLNESQYLSFDIQYSSKKVVFPVPNFILITNDIL